MLQILIKHFTERLPLMLQALLLALAVGGLAYFVLRHPFSMGLGCLVVLLALLAIGGRR